MKKMEGCHLARAVKASPPGILSPNTPQILEPQGLGCCVCPPSLPCAWLAPLLLALRGHFLGKARPHVIWLEVHLLEAVNSTMTGSCLVCSPW